MYARVEEQEPDYSAYAEIKNLALDSEYRAEKEQAEQKCRVYQKTQLYMGGVEGRYHDDAAYVVDYREGGEEYFEGERHALAKHGENAKRESDVGSHGYRRAVSIVRALGEEVVEQHGNHHAAYGADDGKQGLFER